MALIFLVTVSCICASAIQVKKIKKPIFLKLLCIIICVVSQKKTFWILRPSSTETSRFKAPETINL